MKGQQFAVGIDSRVTSINKRFVKTLKKELRNVAIIVLMDACGEAVDGNLEDHDKVAKGAVKGVNDAEEDDDLNGNLIVCAYACQVLSSYAVC